MMDNEPTYSDLEKKIRTLEKKMADLQISERHFRSIIEAAENVGFVLSDVQEPMPHITQFSSGAEKIFGYTRSEAIGRPFSILHRPENHPDYQAIHRRMRESGKGQGYLNEHLHSHKSGGKICLLSSSHPLFDANNNLQSVLVLYIDITRQKELEAQIRESHKMKALGTLAGGISHDFNNILGIIIGNTELALLDIMVSHETKHYLDEIHKASIRARNLVRQILTFSRQALPGHKPVDISLIVKESISLLKATIPSTIKIQSRFPSETDFILADASQIEQIVINLCVNAAQSMKDVFGTMDIGLDNVQMNDGLIENGFHLRPGRYVKLTVKDTGQGITPDDMQHIFDPYFTTKGLADHSGMGLSVVHGIVQNHKGAITVRSEKGQGAVFEVFFPSIEQVSRSPVKSDKTAPLNHGDECILFVDDEEAIGAFARDILEYLGYDVIIEKNPSKAFNLFQEKPDFFDLVITDMTMPEMTGIDLLKKIKQIRPNIPIILCTGYSDLIDEDKANDLGIAAYLVKPIETKDLSKVLRKVLDGDKSNENTL
ncbi:MAG: response regulator [Deltaproteobacteria bacterium]|nr:response regulator [Deltaproteobacteria bacterium]